MVFLNNLIDEGDICGLLIIIAVLGFVGLKLVERQPKLLTWGLRLAVGTFLVFAIVRFNELESTTTSQLVFRVVLSGLAAGGLVLGPAWIVLSVLGFVHKYYKKLEESGERAARDRQLQREQREREQQRQREQQERERLAPERERAANEAREQQLIEGKRADQENQRREDARVACELLYNLREADIRERFPRSQFQDFVDKYMTDNKAVDVVERRAGELQMLIQQHFETVKPPEKLTNLADLTGWFEDQKREIERLPVADIYRDDYLVRLNERYAELSERILDRLEP